MNEIGIFTPEQARLLWQDYLSRKQTQPHIQQNYPQRRPIDEPSPHRVFIKNTSGETMPAYGCGRITGTEVVGGQTLITIEKPTSTSGEFVFNSQFDIAAGATGWAYRYGIVVMLGNGTSPTVANVEYLPVVGSWDIEEGAGPFVVFGEHNAATDAVVGKFAGGGASGTPAIRFRIVEAAYNCSECYVSARIISGSEESAASLPGATYDYANLRYLVDIYDKTGDFFNRPPEELTNLIGHALWLNSYEDGPCPDTLGWHWECIELQCIEGACGTDTIT